MASSTAITRKVATSCIGRTERTKEARHGTPATAGCLFGFYVNLSPACLEVTLNVAQSVGELRRGNRNGQGKPISTKNARAEDITEALLLKAIAAERSAFATKRAAHPMGRGRTTAAEIKKFKDATAAHDAAKAEVAKLRAKLPG